jgi:hypothetical protein
MSDPVPPHDPWPWLELPLLASVERYLDGLEAERQAVRRQAAYLRGQLQALGG